MSSTSPPARSASRSFPTRARTLATIVLALCLALPSYTCPGYIGPDGTTASSIPDDADSAAYSATRIPHYPLEDRSPLDAWFWVTLVAFGWALPLLALRTVRPDSRTTRVLDAAEPVLALASGYLIYAMASMGRPAIGTWLALGANGTILVSWIAARWRSRARREVAQRLGGATAQAG